MQVLIKISLCQARHLHMLMSSSSLRIIHIYCHDYDDNGNYSILLKTGSLDNAIREF